MVDGDGAVVAAQPAATARTAAAAGSLWAAASRRAEHLGGVLDHLVVPLDGGAVAVVEAHGRRAVAVTGPRPTVGLLLFDLRTCLGDVYATAGEVR